MVDSGLKELLRQLPVEEKVELRALLDAELVDYVPAELKVRLDVRWAEVLANPTEYVSIDEDERALRASRRAA